VGTVSRDLTGQVLGDYRVERLLGHGGMGDVYLARQISLDRPVALKILKPELLSNPTYLARFEKEAQSAARLNHANIVTVYNTGQIDGHRYIAMEYVEGTNLKELLARRGIPSNAQALSFLRQAGQAIAAAGEMGLVHRDVKPENLLLTRKGQLKVADFGLCRTITPGGVELTQEGTTLGTPMYMSPEQVQGKELDHRSDLYSLGVTFYHLLAGVPPFKAETPLALALKHVQDEPTSLAVHRPDLPAELVGLVMKLIRKKPAERYQSAGEMVKDLSRIRSAITATASPSAVTEAVTTDSAQEGGSSSANGTSLRSAALAETEAETATRSGRGFSLSGLGRRELILASLVALAVGGFAGVRARAPNLLSNRARGSVGAPGLWMADWTTIPAASTAEAQYRQAQLFSSESERVAAWLAVPGRFPEARDASIKAYVQLARTLFRERDAERLEALGRDFGRSEEAALQPISRVARAGVAALRGDGQEVLNQFSELKFDLLDPAVVELGYEVAEQATRRGGAPSTQLGLLRKLRDQLAATLFLSVLPSA
jgi:serine/threonine-protein kinase